MTQATILNPDIDLGLLIPIHCLEREHAIAINFKTSDIFYVNHDKEDIERHLALQELGGDCAECFIAFNKLSIALNQNVLHLSTYLDKSLECRKWRLKVSARVRSEINAQSYPISVTDSEPGEPAMSGDGWHYENKSGDVIHYPNAYRKAWGKPIYCHSTVNIEVGFKWLIKRGIVQALRSSETSVKEVVNDSN